MCSTVVVTPEIAGEYGDPLPEWIKIVGVKNTPVLEAVQYDLDRGESMIWAGLLWSPQTWSKDSPWRVL
jgi:hypothetical protein